MEREIDLAIADGDHPRARDRAMRIALLIARYFGLQVATRVLGKVLVRLFTLLPQSVY